LPRALALFSWLSEKPKGDLDMDAWIVGLLVLFIFLTFITVVGHLIWIILAWFFRHLFRRQEVQSVVEPEWEKCEHCGTPLAVKDIRCYRCGRERGSPQIRELKKELEATMRQIYRLFKQGAIDEQTYNSIKAALFKERDRILGVTPPPQPSTQYKPATAYTQHPLETWKQPQTTQAQPEQTPTFKQPEVQKDVIESVEPIVTEPVGPTRPVWAYNQTDEQGEPKPPKHEPLAQRPVVQQYMVQQPSRSWAEVVEAFMQESNIRWGEIVGGLLIIGCSTALVISLWNQIAQIPILKFLIFTGVTAAFFGIGLYTEHRWKLPTTSRGILTIATLLVPLNFLAIAAVSSGQVSSLLVLVSEIFAPAVFFIFVYLAGKTLTPRWPMIFGLGVLGTSIGQVLIHHFAGPEMGQARVLGIGALTTLCLVASLALVLRTVGKDEEIGESASNSIFLTLGVSVFAAILPLGLLLYKSASAPDTLMWIAPLIAACAAPVIACGSFLWKRIESEELAYSRLAGTSLAIIGALVIAFSLMLAWPNPASVIPTALINFAVFTFIAILLNLRLAHYVALFAFTLAYTVGFQFLIGKIEWQLAREASLLSVLVSAQTAQAFAPLFLLFVVISELLRRKEKDSDSISYFHASVGVAGIGTLLLYRYAFDWPGDPYYSFFVLAIFAAGLFFFAWTRKLSGLTWAASFILLLSLTQGIGYWHGARFAWQTAALVYSSLATIAAIVFWSKEELRKPIASPLRWAALLSSGFVVFALIQSRPWQSTEMITTKLYWLSLIWFGLLWTIRSQILFAAMQAALTAACLLTVKLILQNTEWYAFNPNVWLHPTALHIYGSTLLLLALAWAAFRFFVKAKAANEIERVLAGGADGASAMSAERNGVERSAKNNIDNEDNEESSLASDGGRADRAPSVKASVQNESGPMQSLSGFLNSQLFTFDRLAALFVLVSFVALTVYGAMHGVARELSLRGDIVTLPDIASYSHTFAYGFTAWIVLVQLLLTMFASFKEKPRLGFLMGAIIVSAMVCPLVASQWETQSATASAWRWTSALFLAAVSIFILKPNLISRFTNSLHEGENFESQRRLILSLALFVGIFPILALTIPPVSLIASGYAIQGASSGFFSFVGYVISYSLPLIIIALVFSLKAVVERNSVSALAAGGVVTFAVVVAHLFSIYSTGGAMDRVVTVQVLQLCAITTAAFSILWLATRHLWAGEDERAYTMLGCLVSFGVAANLILIGPIALRLFAKPTWIGIGTLEAGSVRGWLGLSLCLIAVVWLLKAFNRNIGTTVLFVALMTVSAMFAFTLARWDDGVNWRGYHVLLIGTIATAWLMWFARSLPDYLARTISNDEEQAKPILLFDDSWTTRTAIYSSIAILFVVVMALRTVNANATYWWMVGPIMVISVLAVCLFTSTLNRAFMYAASALLCLATSAWFIWAWPSYWEYEDDPVAKIISFINANVIALALVGITSVILELWKRSEIESEKRYILRFHFFAPFPIFIILSYLCFWSIVGDTFNAALYPSVILTGATIAIVAAYLFACLWDKDAKFTFVLHLYGLLAAAMILDRSNLQSKQLLWIGLVVIGSYALATSLLWTRREALMVAAERLRMSVDKDEPLPCLSWLRVFNFALMCIASILAFVVVVNFVELRLRMLAAFVVVAQAFTLGLLAQGDKRQRWQRVALIVFSFGAVLFGCAWLYPGPESGTWLNRSVVVMIVMFILLAAFGGLQTRLKDKYSDWLDAARKVSPVWAGASALCLAFVLVTEIAQQIEYGKVMTGPVAIAVVGVTLLSAAVVCVMFAIKPENDPLNLSDDKRMIYVYVAEGLVALLFMHIKLSMPWLFTGFFEKYWPLVVVVLSYVGIALSEVLRRNNLITLAQPIERTGVFIPLLPVLGYWMVNSRVDYSLTLFAIGVLYGALSLMRRSFGFGILAALAGNGGLWYALHRTDSFGLIQHPQAWFIPFAVSVLIAAHLNRDKFKEEQIAGVRYVCLMMVYVSSTADIFINGVKTSPWLPLVLMLLSVAGVLSGIMFRIRAFLFLGAAFLLISIVTMIYYASSALQWTWLWWVFGIFIGGSIIFTFALFEKKRQEMLRVIEDMRAWEK
jgi:hypothetical protein